MLIADTKLWDELGNSCRLTLYGIGDHLYEMYQTEFNDSTPVRFVGPIGICINRGEIWLALKKEAGFKEQLPSFKPN